MLIKESGHCHSIIRLGIVEDFSTHFKFMTLLLLVHASQAALISEPASHLVRFPSCSGVVSVNLLFYLKVMVVQCNEILAQNMLFSNSFFCCCGLTCKYLTHTEILRRMHEGTKMKVK